MKKLLPLAWLLPAFLLSACVKDEVTRTYTIMRPIFAHKATVLEQINSGPAKQLENPGKIFIKGNYIFINEVDKGIHIIDNTNPSSPRAVAFVSIPGNIDVAVKANFLYADFYTDMLTIDISDPLNIKVVDTAASVFPERFYGNGWSTNPDQVITGWDRKDTTVAADDVDNSLQFLGGCAFCTVSPRETAAFDNAGSKSSQVPGIAGSMSRFVIMDNYMYTVNISSLIVFDVSDPAAPKRASETYAGWQIETVYPFKDKLFMGSTTGMFIYDVSDPLAPQPNGMFAHARTCDPVVADDDYAYVTLRSGDDQCAGNTNQLDVIDVSDVMNPMLVKTYPMTKPYGLGKDGDLLFVCDGGDGIKVYDASDVNNLTMVTRIADVEAFDVIPWSGRLIASTKQGLNQYDYSDRNNIRLLSTIHTSPAR